MTALQGKGVIGTVFRNRIVTAFFMALAMTLAAEHAIAADPIARIGLIGRAQLGLSTRLESTGQNDPGARFSWQLTQRPKKSKAKLNDNNAARASFVPDVPGRYVVQLTVRLRNSSDTASLDVTPAASGPLLPVNTMDMSDGTPTMYINGTPYPDFGNSSLNPPLLPGQGFHVVIVDRNTLGTVAGTTTNASYAANSSGISAMSTALGKLSKTSGTILVLVSLPGGVTIPSSDLANLNTALNNIGGVVPQGWEMGKTNPNLQTCWSSNQIQCYLNDPVWQVSSTGWTGAFSVIGVPGMSYGGAWYNDAQQDPASGGALVGYLSPSVIITQSGGLSEGHAYIFAHTDQYVIVDTCAPLPVPQGSGCVIDVNGQTYPPLNGITNGMTVVVLDRVTLSPLAYNTVTNTADLYNTIYTANKWSSGHFFYGPYNATNPISDRVIVLLQSVGSGILNFSPLGSKDYGTALLQLIDQLGGTPETFGNCLQVGNPPAFGTYPPATQLYGGYCRQTGGPGPYALVGVAGNLPWHGKGIESSPVISDTLGCTDSTCFFPGRSRGVLARDRFGRYTPTTFDPQGSAILDLASIVYQAPQAWPNADSCAIQWIFQGLQQQGGLSNVSQPLIRSSYVTDPTNPIWNYNTKVDYPNPLPAGFCPADNPFPDLDTYNSIMQELQVEFRWVQYTNIFLNSISIVFGTTQGNTQVSQIAGNIYSTMKPPTENTNVPWQAIADLSFATIGTAAPETQGVLGVVAASITIGTDATSTSPTSNPTKQFIAATNQVANTLDRQTIGYLWTLTNVLRPILYSDYGKLSIVGQNVFTQAWPWNSDIAQIAAGNLNATTTQAVYSALLPTVWPMVELKPDLITQFQSADLTKFICWHPDDGDTQYQNDAFGHALIQNQFLSLYQLQLTHSGTNSLETANYEAWTWADYDIYSSFTARPTDTSLYNPLFLSPLDGAGAGAYPPAWYRSTYNPPDFVRCGSTAVYSGTEQHAPKALSPTAAGYTLN